MKKKSFNILIPVFTALIMCLTGCSNIQKVKEIRVTSLMIEKISPAGLRGLDVYLAVGIDNPAFQIGLTEINGSLTHSGKVLGKVAVDPFTLQGKTADTYRLDVELSLAEGVNVLDLGVLLDKESLEKMTVDVSADVRIRKGKTRTMKINDLPVKKLIEAVK